MTARFDLIAPPHAPLHPDGSLNVDLVERQAEHFVRHGLSGVFVSGTTGESQSLTVPERLKLARRWIDVCRDGELDVIIQVGSNCVEDARVMAEDAQKCGADAVAMHAPSFLKPDSVDALIDCCEPVAAAAGDLPFYVYDIPVLTGIRVSMPEFLDRGHQRIFNLRGLKYTNPDLVQLQECLDLNDGQFDILFGCDEILLTSVLLGCPGAVGSTYNFAAGHYQAMIQSFHAGDLVAARKAQREAVRMIRLLQRHDFLTACKAVMSFQGLDCGPVRPPLRNLSPATLSLLREEFEALPMFQQPARDASSVAETQR